MGYTLVEQKDSTKQRKIITHIPNNHISGVILKNISSAALKGMLFAGVLSVAAIAAVACANGSPTNPDESLSPQTVARPVEPAPSLHEHKPIPNSALEPSWEPGSPAASSGDLAASGNSKSEAPTEAIPSGESIVAAAIAAPEPSPADVATASSQEATPTTTVIPPSAAASEATPTVEPAVVPVHIALKSSKEVTIDFSQFRQMIPRDAIAPIYEPKFVAADKSPLPGSELVIGVELNGESRAYPVGPLNDREMVNDVVGGIPILVSW